MVEDLQDLGPVQLSKEAGISREQALSVLRECDPKNISSKPTSALTLMQDAEANRRITSLSDSFDSLLGGGLQPQQVTEICGTPGIGKTQLCIQFAVNSQIPAAFGGVDGDVMYIDTEGGFMIERVVDIAEGTLQYIQNYARCNQAQNLVRASEEFKLEHILSHIQYFRASDYIELVALVKTLPALVQNSQRKVRLVVIDSIAAPFRQNFDDMRTRTSMLQSISQELNKLAAEHNLAILISNHVTTKITNSEAIIVPALGETWAHNANSRIYCSWKNAKRHAYLMKSAACGKKTVVYAVDHGGVRDDCEPKRPREENAPSQ